MGQADRKPMAGEAEDHSSGREPTATHGPTCGDADSRDRDDSLPFADGPAGRIEKGDIITQGLISSDIEDVRYALVAALSDEDE